MIQGLKLLDAVGYRSINSEGLKNLFVFNVIGGIFLGVGVERLSTHVDYDGTAQLEGISLSYFWLLNICRVTFVSFYLKPISPQVAAKIHLLCLYGRFV